MARKRPEIGVCEGIVCAVLTAFSDQAVHSQAPAHFGVQHSDRRMTPGSDVHTKPLR